MAPPLLQSAASVWPAFVVAGVDVSHSWPHRDLRRQARVGDLSDGGARTSERECLTVDVQAHARGPARHMREAGPISSSLFEPASWIHACYGGCGASA